jgi:hypothetical protein
MALLLVQLRTKTSKLLSILRLLMPFASESLALALLMVETLSMLLLEALNVSIMISKRNLNCE